MTLTIEVARFFSAFAFLAYGTACLTTARMQGEFERYGLPHMRRLTGALEVAGGVGLLAGLIVPWIGMLAAAGLTLLMALGTWTRVRIRDPFVLTVPALFFCLLNAGLLVALLVQHDVA